MEVMGTHCFQATQVMSKILQGWRGTTTAVGNNPNRLDNNNNNTVKPETVTDNKTVYGQDRRQHIKHAPGDFQQASSCVVSLWQRSKIERVGRAVTLVTKSYRYAPFGEELCELSENVPFVGERLGPFGSGFFVRYKDQDYVITARHCVLSEGYSRKIDKDNATISTNLESIYFVFGWNDNGIERLPVENVFTGELVVLGFDADFVIIKLKKSLADKEVPQTFASAKLRLKTEDLAATTQLHIVGHPCGLSMKYAGQGKILAGSRKPLTFETNLTSFAGNSGSPVFNEVREVVGILVQGQADYRPGPDGKLIEAIYPDNPVRGEICVKINIEPIREFFSSD
mmetsp:Transcript_14874/g.20774  ORF Transcript_14874/g.20774 Transcript_14874/m.20774 type:complete len:341 (+) Transcript_14874:1-1023(+)